MTPQNILSYPVFSYYRSVPISKLTTSIRRLSCFLLAFLFLCAGGNTLYAQKTFNADSASRARKQALDIARTSQKHRQDSSREAQQALIAAMRDAQKRALDSARESRQEMLDDLKEARQRRTDSLQAIRKHRESRAYRDSVTSAREEKIAAIREVQAARLDSMKEARIRSSDSLIAVREAETAVRKRIQQQRADSLTRIRSYRTSKRFTDSVAIVRRVRMDSLHDARKAYTDSLTAARKENLEKLKAARKLVTDSLAASRKVHGDSLAAVRKDKAAAMAKNKDNKAREQKIKEKQAKDKFDLAIDLKIKKKRSVYSNENMLKKKWSVPRKAVQNTFTHYNYYFNANRKMEEAEDNMQRTAKDDWDARIPLFSLDPSKDSTRFSADMDSVIQKASLGIQIHDPRTKWGDDLYLLLGKAYYYKGDAENAANSFKYIVALREKAKADEAKKNALSNRTVRGGKKEPSSIVTPQDKGMLDFLKHHPANNEALLWLTRTYTTYDKYNESESLIDLLGADSKFPENLRGRLALEKGYLALKQHNDKEAAAMLAVVAADKSLPTDLRRRAAYLDGQILQESGDYNSAADKYALVTELHPKIDMDFYARRNRAYALMQSGGVQKDAIASLKSMLNDGKFRSYYEQIYYVLGRLSANSGDNQGAIAYLQQGISAPKSTKKQKAVSFAALGNIYFNTGNYAGAKTAFDSVKKLAQYAAEDSSVMLASARALVVDKIAEPAGIIHQQDSLLALGKKSEKEQRSVVRSYIRSLERKQADSAFRAENGAGTPAVVTGDGSGDPGAMTWYFSTPTLVQQGVTEFKRKWGNRPGVDNWRRSAALAATGNNIAGGPQGSSGTGTDQGNAGVSDVGLPSEETLMSYIPVSAEARATATSTLQRAYVDMSTAYLRQFEDYTRSSAMLDTLDRRWPSNPYAAEATYLRYLIALRRNNLKDAQALSNKLRADFPASQWAEMVAPPDNSGNEGKSSGNIGEYYDDTYSLLQRREYGEVLGRARNSRRQFPADQAYTNRFRIVEAMAYAGSAQYGQADTLLTTFIKTHPGDILLPWAERVLAFVTEKRKADTVKRVPDASLPAALLTPGAGNNTLNAAGPAGPANPANPASAKLPIDTATGPVPTDYSYKPQDRHYFIFSVGKMESKVMGVKAGIGDLNKFTANSDGLTTEIQPMAGGKVAIVVKSFKNAAAAKSYMSMFQAAKMLVREYQPNEYQTFIISANNYRKLESDGMIGTYMVFYRSHY